MAAKTSEGRFEQMLNALRAHSFDVTREPDGGTRVSKDGVATVLVPGETNALYESGGARMAITPGIVVRGEIGRLLDRGYQKFIKTSQFELPATAMQLQSIHRFTEELNQLTAALGLYNESLGTTSDVYQYDRLKGREAPQQAPARPWDQSGGH